MSIYFLYIFVALLSYVTPGPDWLIISKNTFNSKKEGLLSAIGVQCGLFFHMILAVIGASAIFLASKNAFFFIQLLGGIYISWLGISSLKEIITNNDEVSISNDAGKSFITSPFISGLTANILNPKVAIFFISILPQFVSSGGSIIHQVFILGVIDIIVGIFWWIAFVFLINKLYKLSSDDSLKKKVEIFTSSVLLIIGVFFVIKSIISILS